MILPARIAEKIRVDEASGCWRWLAMTDRNGYARLQVDGGPKQASRIVYEILVGPIPDSLELDHVAKRGCLYRDCVNPAHLEPVTHKVNVLRGNGACARNARKTECKRGHAFDETNTGRQKDGGRFCRTCKKAADGARVYA